MSEELRRGVGTGVATKYVALLVYREVRSYAVPQTRSHLKEHEPRNSKSLVPEHARSK